MHYGGWASFGSPFLLQPCPTPIFHLGQTGPTPTHLPTQGPAHPSAWVPPSTRWLPSSDRRGLGHTIAFRLAGVGGGDNHCPRRKEKIQSVTSRWGGGDRSALGWSWYGVYSTRSITLSRLKFICCRHAFGGLAHTLVVSNQCLNCFRPPAGHVFIKPKSVET